MANNRQLTEEKKKLVDKLRREYAEELKQQFGEYIFDDDDIKFPFATLSELREIIDLDESTISRQLKSPYKKDSRPQNVDTMRQSIAKIRGINRFEKRMKVKHQEEVEKLIGRIRELENIIKESNPEHIQKENLKISYKPKIEKLEAETESLKQQLNSLSEEIRLIKRDLQ